MSTRKFKYCLFLLLIHFIVHAQNKVMRFNRIISNNIISNNSINEIIQDKYGFIWIATSNGLNRFDGYNFKIYKNKSSHEDELNETVIRELLIDKQQNLWVFGDNLNMYDDQKDIFIQYTNPYKAAITKVTNDYKDNFWFNGSNTGKLLKFDQHSKKFSDIGSQISFLKNTANVIILGIDKSDNIWIQADYDIFRLNLRKYYSGILDYKCFKKQYYYKCFYEEVNHDILLGNDKYGWYKYNKISDSIILLSGKKGIFDPIRDEQIISIIVDRNGWTWIATFGIYVFDKNGKLMSHLINNSFDQTSIPNN